MLEPVISWPSVILFLLNKTNLPNNISNTISVIIIDIIAFTLMYYMIKIVKKYIKTKIWRILLYTFLSFIILFAPILCTFIQLAYIFLGPIT